jgi:hypothetical protein
LVSSAYRANLAFCQFLQENVSVIVKIKPWLHPFHHFQFIIHSSFFHSLP